MQKRNIAEQEKYLNQVYSDSFTEDQAVEQFIYLTNKSRAGGVTTENKIRKAYRDRTLGRLLRRLDFTAFNCA